MNSEDGLNIKVIKENAANNRQKVQGSVRANPTKIQYP